MTTATVLEYTRDVRSQFERAEAGEFVARIRGIVTERKNAGRAQFIELLDVTGSIQVIFLSEAFAVEDDYTYCKQLRVGQVVSVQGPFKLNNGGRLSVFPSDRPEIITGDTLLPISQADLPYRAAGSKMIQARIIKRLRQFLDANGFVEIEPRYLSTRWDGNGLEPIHAVFAGFGVPVYLNPSPLPQLFEVLISTGQKKLHAVGRCFCSSVRDDKSSTEATTLFCLEHIDKPRPNQPIWEFALGNLVSLFQGTDTAPDGRSIRLEDATIVSSDWPLKIPEKEGLYVQHCADPIIPARASSPHISKLKEATVKQFARLTLVAGAQQYIFAEITQERRFNAIDVLCTTYHTEHILDLLSTAPFRALRTSTFWND